jgi:hypothetical protein
MGTGLLVLVEQKTRAKTGLTVLIQQVMQADGTSLDVDMKSEKLIAVQRTTCPTKTTTLNLKNETLRIHILYTERS